MTYQLTVFFAISPRIQCKANSIKVTSEMRNANRRLWIEWILALNPSNPAKEGPGLRLNLTSLQRWISQSLRFEARDLDNISWLRVVLANAASRKLDHRMSPKTS